MESRDLESILCPDTELLYNLERVPYIQYFFFLSYFNIEQANLPIELPELEAWFSVAPAICIITCISANQGYENLITMTALCICFAQESVDRQ